MRDPAGGEPVSRPRIVIVGAGFAGYRTARTLVTADPEQGRHHPAQPDRLLPVSAPAAPGRRRHPGTAPGHRLPDRHPAPRTAGARRGRRHRPRRAYGALLGPRGRRRHADLRPAGARRRQREQAAADPRRRRARARLPRAARGAVPPRPRDPAGGAGRRQRGPQELRRAVHLRGGRRRLHRHRSRRARPAVHRRAGTQAAAAARACGRAGCCSTSRRACCPSWTSGCPAPPTGCCGSGVSTCGRGPP